MLETVIVTLLFLLLSIATVAFGVSVVWLIVVEIRDRKRRVQNEENSKFNFSNNNNVVSRV
jgi:hypothetical protein